MQPGCTLCAQSMTPPIPCAKHVHVSQTLRSLTYALFTLNSVPACPSS